jgi:XTP/dITP diphosphohydrolase
MQARRRVVLATNNPGKIREMQALLEPLGMEILAQSEFDVLPVAETGHSFVENAIIKARHAAKTTGLPAIADDSGLLVDILDGAPGIYSARFAGINATDAENLELLIRQVDAAGLPQPAARFHCAMAYLRDAGDALPVLSQASWRGHIVTRPRGSNGFGYDPIFFVPTHQCTSAELPPAVKNRISHRGQAMVKLLKELTDDMGDH